MKLGGLLCMDHKSIILLCLLIAGRSQEFKTLKRLP